MFALLSYFGQNTIINIFIIIYIYAAWYWSHPDVPAAKIIFMPFIRSIVLHFGLWHSWSVFVDPSRNNNTIIASIELEDGSKERHIVYNPDTGIFMGRRATVRDIKYIENLCNENNKFLREHLFPHLKDYFSSICKVVKNIDLILEIEVTSTFNSKDKPKNLIVNLYSSSKESA